MVARGRVEERTAAGKQEHRESHDGTAARADPAAGRVQRLRGGGRASGCAATKSSGHASFNAGSVGFEDELSARFVAAVGQRRELTRSLADSCSSDLESSASSDGVVFEASTPVHSEQHVPEQKPSSQDASKVRATPPLAQHTHMADSLSVHKLLDLQENEFIAICSIFEEGVEELPVEGALGEDVSVVDSAAAGGEGSSHSSRKFMVASSGSSNPEAAPAKFRASTPVRRYRVKLAARSGCSAGMPPCGHGEARAATGPSAELEVVYGRLYPLESPLLLLSNIDGVHKVARQELRAIVKDEIEKLSGRECVFDVCMAIREHLRQHYDPSADLPLHERFQRREAEEAEKRKAAEREGRERAERVKVEQRERQILELERIKEKHRAAKRLGQAFHHGGDLNFLPESSVTELAALEKPEDESVVREEEAALPGAANAAPGKPAKLAAGRRKLLVPRGGAGPSQLHVGPGKDICAGAASSGGRYATDFEELRFLGRGGFGAVTMVRHRVDKYLYAIKRIELSGPASSRDKLLQECSTLPRLSHLHIVRYYQAWIERDSVVAQQAPLAHTIAREDAAPARLRQIRRIASTENVGEVDDWLSHPHERSQTHWAPQCHPTTTLREFLYIQMEFCDGTTLREAINSGELHKDVALIWKLFRQVLDALAYIHSKGLIHRDLKPPNIFLSRADGGHAKIGDFGLTTAVHPDLASIERNDTGACAVDHSKSTGVGTVFYMAPEMVQLAEPILGKKGRQARRPAKRNSESRSYDQKVDMFSLGVIFFEMWHPPFSTFMERARVLGELAMGLAGPADGVARSGAGALLPRDVQAPKEVGQILGSLLAREPSERMSAAQLLDGNTGLLPPGAYDPQVQRILTALKCPGSTESVALIEALFSRCEEVAKDSPFFERLLQASAQTPEVEAEARDALQQLLRETCRRHGAVYDLCPLLRPARATACDKADMWRGGRPQLLDKDNTRVELRTNLTEPFARVGAARLAAKEEEDHGSGFLPSWPSPTSRRQYHMGTVYHNYKGAQFGHPMEISSSVVQFLWHPACLPSAPVPASSSTSWPRSQSSSQASEASVHEAELLHLLAEFLAAAGLGGPAGHAELQLADTRLLSLLLDCAAQKTIREARPVDPPANTAQASRLARLAEAVDRLTSEHVVGGSRSRAILELAGVLLTASTSDGRSVSEVGAIKTLPLSIHGIAKLHDSYALGPTTSSAEPQAPSSAGKLWDMLEGLRSLSRMLEGLLEVTVDVFWQGRDVTYGPGLAFRLLLHDVTGPSVLVGEGGRLDSLMCQFMELHAPHAAFSDGCSAGLAGEASPTQYSAAPALPAAPAPPLMPCGVSVELALDKLAAAVVAAAQSAAQQAVTSGPTGGCAWHSSNTTWRRGSRGNSVSGTVGSSGSGMGAGDRAGFVGPWWRQLPSCSPLILVGVAQEDLGANGSAHLSCLTHEALRIARGLWLLGARCRVKPAEVGPLDVKALGVAHRQNFVGEALCGPALPDFAVLLRGAAGQHHPASGEASGGGGNGEGLCGAQIGWPPPTQRRVGSSGTSPSLGPTSASPAVVGAPGGFDQSVGDEGFAYQVRAVSDQALDIMERAIKDVGPREFDDRLRVFELFEKMGRRFPSRPLGQALPRHTLEALSEH